MECKTDWIFDDIVKPGDMNRIERNTKELNTKKADGEGLSFFVKNGILNVSYDDGEE